LRIARLLENRKALPRIAAVRYKHMVAEAWIRENRHHEAGHLIQEALKQYWDSGLAFLYGQCDFNPKEQLAVAEGWLQRHPQDAEVNWVLGRLCQRLQIWGKARMHLEASLRHRPMVQTHLALAEIAEALVDPETASFHWKAAACFR
jgi:HemY protein